MNSSVLNFINERYTVKSFLPKAIPKEILDNIVAAAQDAPSKQNKYPYRLYVITNDTEKGRQLKEKLYEHTACDITLANKASRFYQNEIKTAPVSIFATIKPQLEDWEEGTLHERASTMRSTRDAMLPIIFMLLQAVEHGLGTACTGCFAEGVRNIDQLRKDFDLDDDEYPCVVLNLGYIDPAKTEDQCNLPKIPRATTSDGDVIYAKTLDFIDQENPGLGVTDPINHGPTKKMQPRDFIQFIN